MISFEQRIENLRDAGFEVEVPDDFKGPLTLSIMQDPVILPSGITLERSSALSLYNSLEDKSYDNKKCPLTNEIIADEETHELLPYYPNQLLKRQIIEFVEQQENKAKSLLQIQKLKRKITELEGDLESKTQDLTHLREEFQEHKVLSQATIQSLKHENKSLKVEKRKLEDIQEKSKRNSGGLFSYFNIFANSSSAAKPTEEKPKLPAAKKRRKGN